MKSSRLEKDKKIGDNTIKDIRNLLKLKKVLILPELIKPPPPFTNFQGTLKLNFFL